MCFCLPETNDYQGSFDPFSESILLGQLSHVFQQNRDPYLCLSAPRTDDWGGGKGAPAPTININWPTTGARAKTKDGKTFVFFFWQHFPLKAPKGFRVSHWQSSLFTLLLLNLYLDRNQECNIYVQLYIN